METIEVTVDALVLTSWGGALRQTADGWEADVYCSIMPHEAGIRIMGAPYQQLALLGLVTRYDAVLVYPGAEAPSAAQVGQDMLQWVGVTHGTAAAAWVGKKATAFVAAGE